MSKHSQQRKSVFFCLYVCRCWYCFFLLIHALFVFFSSFFFMCDSHIAIQSEYRHRHTGIDKDAQYITLAKPLGVISIFHSGECVDFCVLLIVIIFVRLSFLSATGRVSFRFCDEVVFYERSFIFRSLLLFIRSRCNFHY